MTEVEEATVEAVVWAVVVTAVAGMGVVWAEVMAAVGTVVKEVEMAAVETVEAMVEETVEAETVEPLAVTEGEVETTAGTVTVVVVMVGGEVVETTEENEDGVAPTEGTEVSKEEEAMTAVEAGKGVTMAVEATTAVETEKGVTMAVEARRGAMTAVVEQVVAKEAQMVVVTTGWSTYLQNLMRFVPSELVSRSIRIHSNGDPFLHECTPLDDRNVPMSMWHHPT